MKIAFVARFGATDGVEYHRLWIPHVNLTSRYDITEVNGIGQEHPEFITNFQIVVSNRYLGSDPAESRRIADKAGTKLILDLDDYWNLPPSHLLHQRYKEGKTPKYMVDCIKAAHHVTTTTEYFANVIRQYNPNVTVIPNAIDPNQPQNMVSIQGERDERVNVGWIGGIHHHKDLLLLQSSIKDTYQDKALSGKFRFMLGGWNAQYEHFERIFTNNYCDQSFDSYGRINALPVDKYMTMYEFIDVALAPLVDDEFNRCKSQLKLIEAGYKKKPVIASAIAPYLIDGIHGKNCLLVEPNAPQRFRKYMKRLIESEQMRVDLGEALHEVVKSKYMIEHANKIRTELYDRIAGV